VIYGNLTTGGMHDGMQMPSCVLPQDTGSRALSFSDRFCVCQDVCPQIWS